MHTESLSLAHQADRPVDPWALVAGGSVGIVGGFAVDLLRLGVYEAGQAFAARSRDAHLAMRGWRCPRTCDAGAR